MSRTQLAFATLTLTIAAFSPHDAARAQPPAAGRTLATDLGTRAIDLTYPFDEHTIYWPTDPTFHWEKAKWGMTPDGYWYASARYAASEHGGTHLDSPIHFGAGQATAEQIPISRLIAPAVVVDVQVACARDRDYMLRREDLENWEKAHGKIPDGAIVLMRSGWGKFWPDKIRYLGSDVHGDTAHLHFPGISPEAAAWLVANRKIAGIAVDTASLDHGPAREYLAHRTLNGAGIYGLENVANAEKLPEAGATLIVLPMKIKGGSGAPARIIAILP
jgi:kynurenine formamidase